jgi:hypothetical protein
MVRFKDDLTGLVGPDATAEAKSRIERKLATMGVLDELSDSHRQQIVDRVFSTTRTYQVFRNRVQEAKPRIGFSDRELRRLNTRVRRLKRAIEDLADEAARIDSEDDLWGWLGGDHFSELLDELGHRVDVLGPPEGADDDRPSARSLQDVRTSCSSLLMLAFAVCGIRLGPASWRVAKIENAFWEGNVQETDEGTNRRRSSAIWKRLHRPNKRR